MSKNNLNLPHNLEAEKALLANLINRGYFDQSVLLSSNDFSSHRHQRIYLAMAQLADAGEPVDLPTLVDTLERKGELEKIGGVVYLAGLDQGIPFSNNLAQWEKLIRESAIRRYAMKWAELFTTLAQTDDFERLSMEAEKLRLLLESRRVEDEDDSLETLEREYEQYVKNLDARSIRFGIRELDECIGGFQFGELVTVIARTGVGKSALAQNVIGNVLKNYPESGAVLFSLEMPRLQAFERQLQIFAGKKRGEIISAYRQGDKARVNAEEFLSRYRDRLRIIDNPGITLAEIERRVSGYMALKRIKPVHLVVIDYLGYLGGGNKNAGVVERISELARGVKLLARNLGAVVLLIAQTSRKAGDGSEEVTVTDARDSGAIEDSADFLIGCWRPELKAGISTDDFADVHGELWFRILKARRGLQDRFCVRFEGETLRVLEPEAQEVSVPWDEAPKFDTPRKGQ